ncbi:MAG: hypothetical protein GTN76_06655 [Candidatus Aenigmarchaeota archaeon]|nr:hypothetical protein [Candidatus Aenigmarchaeota archaeon]
MESPIGIIVNMIVTIITNGINTLAEVFGLFLNLLESLGFVTKIGGFPLFIASVVIICLVIYFLGKFFFNVGKQIILLFVIGVILVWIIILSVV